MSPGKRKTRKQRRRRPAARARGAAAAAGSERHRAGARRWLPLGSCLLGAAAARLALPFGHGSAWPLLFALAGFCWVPALLAGGLRGSARRAFGRGLLAALLFFALDLGWIYRAVTEFAHAGAGAALALTVALSLACAAFWAAAFAAYAALESRPSRLPIPRPLLFAAIWCAAEFARTVCFTGFPWGTLGVALSGNALLAQLAALGGVHLLTFFAALVNGLAAWAIAAQLARRPGARAATQPPSLRALRWRWSVLAATLVAALAFGAARRATIAGRLRAAPALRVGLVQGNFDPRTASGPVSREEGILAAYVRPTRALLAAHPPPELIVWPESVLPAAVDLAESTLARRALPLALPPRSQLLLGADAQLPGLGRINAALLVAAQQRIVARYAKQHLVPFGEYVPRWLTATGLRPLVHHSYAEGSRSTIELKRPQRDGGALRIGVLICFESLFPRLARRAASAGAKLIVLLTNDAWLGERGAPRQFVAFARLRAIETGKAIVRAAKTGISGLVLPDGRLASPIPIGLVPGSHGRLDMRQLVPPASRLQDVPLLEDSPPYVALGDAIVWLSLLGLALATIGALLAARRRPPAQDGG